MTKLSLVEDKVPGEVEDRLEEIAKGIETVQATAIIKIGERLAEARDLFRYDRREGGFGGWVERRLGISKVNAYGMISVFERLGESVRNSEHFEGLAKETLLQLAAPSTPAEVRAEVEQMLIDGQKVTAADVKRMKAELQDAANSTYDIRDRAEKACARARELESEIESLSRRAESDAPNAKVARLSQDNRDLREQLETLQRRLAKLTSPEPEAPPEHTLNVVRLPAADVPSDDPMNDTDPTSGTDAWHQIGGSLAIMLNTNIDAPEFWRISHQFPMSRDAMRDKVFRGLTMLAKLVEGYDQ